HGSRLAADRSPTMWRIWTLTSAQAEAVMRFDLTDLRLFRHVAETGSITHGAERSHLALASASARIRGMEEMLDVPLLQRGRRGVRLTDAGLSLLDHAPLRPQPAATIPRGLSPS